MREVKKRMFHTLMKYVYDGMVVCVANPYSYHLDLVGSGLTHSWSLAGEEGSV